MDKPWLAHYEQGVPSTLAYPRIPLFQMLTDSARQYPDQVAVNMILRYLPGGLRIAARLTYRQLDELTNRFAAALSGLGVRKGDRVAVMLPNTPQFIIAFYGAMKAGAIVVNTNPTYTAREMKQQFADAGAETVVLLSQFYRNLQQIQKEIQVKHAIITDIHDFVAAPFKGLVKRTLKKEGHLLEVAPSEGIHFLTDLLAKHPPSPPVEVSANDVALFQYTGGTTGIPKAAMLSHYNLVVNTIQTKTWLKTIEPGKERMMGAIPFFHVYGMTVAMSLGIFVGAQTFVVPNPRPIDNVMRIIQRERCTIYPGVPAMYIGIINHPKVQEYDLRSVKACISGAAPLAMEVQERFEKLTGGRLVEGYGLTEAAPVTHCNPIYGLRKAGSIGTPFPDVEAKIVTLEPVHDGRRGDVPVGQEGELALRGPQVMVGYWQKPEETAIAKDAEGWLYTGDIAKMDEDGYFYIVDRKKDLIIVSGYNVVPREVEEVLFTHPKVMEAVVIGVADQYRNERVKAFIVLKAGETATADEIIAFCRERLAPYKVPRFVDFRSELPRTMVGKFLRRVRVEEEKAKMAAEK
ncbi:MAG: long-chain fatty acid--CoA ligase [Anaerolineae bacterium]|nr:long-chain fatty acid--CoA ligase [Anaerolineae bacterium]